MLSQSTAQMDQALTIVDGQREHTQGFALLTANRQQPTTTQASHVLEKMIMQRAVLSQKPPSGVARPIVHIASHLAQIGSGWAWRLVEIGTEQMCIGPQALVVAHWLADAAAAFQKAVGTKGAPLDFEDVIA
jgi:hypothetical protein